EPSLGRGGNRELGRLALLGDGEGERGRLGGTTAAAAGDDDAGHEHGERGAHRLRTAERGSHEGPPARSGACSTAGPPARRARYPHPADLNLASSPCGPTLGA